MLCGFMSASQTDTLPSSTPFRLGASLIYVLVVLLAYVSGRTCNYCRVNFVIYYEAALSFLSLYPFLTLPV